MYSIRSALWRCVNFLLGIGNATSQWAASSLGLRRPAARTDVLRVHRCEFAVTGAYVEILLKATSSVGARLFASLPNGSYLGEVVNGGDASGSGTVFVVAEIPASITLWSSAGGILTVPCVPYQP